ncbi:hypothetical protein UFOVP98_27 [uncultured Caudovirales phage]|uniref:Uncharacterized protein n=1 Tax=uncultured Caudovirales phage TaxID=2100421 RepID=A0A6J5LJM2_9CAUD|nr:hypothetical protein UFOVP98_27 [uncultured Caudovirales phage]CAB4134381.1 hypothetical protein UFOVP269_43 [uncultured Caudovirales phage]
MSFLSTFVLNHLVTAVEQEFASSTVQQSIIDEVILVSQELTAWVESKTSAKAATPTDAAS